MGDNSSFNIPNEKSRFNVSIDLHKTQVESLVGKKESQIKIKVKYNGTEVYDLTLSPKEVSEYFKNSKVGDIALKIKKQSNMVFKKVKPYGLAALKEINNVGGKVFKEINDNKKLKKIEVEVNKVLNKVLDESNSLAKQFFAFTNKSTTASSKQTQLETSVSESVAKTEPVTKEAKIFRSVGKKLKYALSEFYTADVVFLRQLKNLQKESFLTDNDRVQLNKLIKNTESMLHALPTFAQLGVDQAAEKRTLDQDLRTAISLQANSHTHEAKKFKMIVTLQGKIGEFNGKAMYEKDDKKKRDYQTKVVAYELKINKIMQGLKAYSSKEAQEIVNKYERVEFLNKQLKNLPEIPNGVLDNLSDLMKTNALKDQYELLSYFKKRLDEMKDGPSEHYNKVQEIGSKITRYGLLMKAITEIIPQEMAHNGLKELEVFFNNEAVKINNQDK